MKDLINDTIDNELTDFIKYTNELKKIKFNNFFKIGKRYSITYNYYSDWYETITGTVIKKTNGNIIIADLNKKSNNTNIKDGIHYSEITKATCLNNSAP